MSTDKQTRVAVVTGAARGIGKSIALRLADDGLDVAINDMPDQKELLESVAEEIQKKGRRAVTLCGDASEEKDVKALVDKAVEELGGVDVVSSTVHAACHSSTYFSTDDGSRWWQML
jgi:NAD(P)-dependent dehydrogenase (short-subunit alcohol dehydrogenase family)